MKRSVYLALGARDGDPLEQMRSGLAHLLDSGLDLASASSLWETEPVGIPGERPVLNSAVEMLTDLAPRSLLAACHHAEEAAGRRRFSERRPEWRSLDVDILLDGTLVLLESDLSIPHPRFHLRRFNLDPLNEIAPAVLHPVLELTVAELLRSCADRAWTRRLEVPDWAPARVVERGRGLH
jgi:2-amino-4-hydroxy-6-hydroxymethyldihydropteridine diphosphokinase